MKYNHIYLLIIHISIIYVIKKYKIHHIQFISLIENYGQNLERKERRQLIHIEEKSVIKEPDKNYKIK